MWAGNFDYANKFHFSYVLSEYLRIHSAKHHDVFCWMNEIYIWHIKTSHKTMRVYSTKFCCPYICIILWCCPAIQPHWLTGLKTPSYLLFFNVQNKVHKRKKKKNETRNIHSEGIAFWSERSLNFSYFFLSMASGSKNTWKKENKYLDPPPPPTHTHTTTPKVFRL